MPLHVRTPTWDSTPLSRHLGARVWLKMEALQPVGSFKIRGVGRLCEVSVRDGAKRLVSSSGGNAGYAVAYAGRRLGVPVTVVVPRRTSSFMRGIIRREDAEVVEHGEVWDDAHERAQVIAEEEDGVYVHPFDHPEIWRGHATMINEVAEDVSRPDVVLVSVGGGGLLCGVLAGLHAVGWRDVPVLAVETEGAASYARALEAGELVTLAAIDSIATTLGARRVCEEALAWSRRHPVTSLLVDDVAAVDACERFAGDHRVLVEPACGAALAPVYARDPRVAAAPSVLVIVCGGADASLGIMRERRERVSRG